MAAKGTLIPIGGNEDKGMGDNEKYTLEYVHTGILSSLVKECGGKDALIIVIPTASSIPDEVSETYKEAFHKLGCTQVHIMDIRSREDAELPEYLELMERADGIMFSGGDQSKIVSFIGETELDRIIKRKYKNEAFVIAGTSAGAMCMSQEMILGGGNQEMMRKGSVSMGKGMGYIPRLIIDSHFIQRRRFGRLAEAVAQFPQNIGIGLAEDTGIVIKNETECEVIGSGMIVLFDGRKITHNNHEILKDGVPMTLTNLKTHILALGDKFNFKKIEIEFAPDQVLEEDLHQK